jgi:hypothetical protein
MTTQIGVLCRFADARAGALGVVEDFSYFGFGAQLRARG